ncbi:MAG TPA: type I DNA topoisomerase [Anaerolineaceae bacterium]|nr:type I DNA topoisomerase [Anaerolineaceae bacterium]HQF45598.1 type I DNA topoisomerase [Anaerolineaceae bacterium]HQH34897.1 type I DNA topoisomerase [Anaerolineaceae bacterium]HQJ03123.1 type I DNA topoisomerase [Anaerolineaceae bacterium]
MEAYCVKCKEKREVENPQPAFNRGGTPITRGTCGVCGTTMIRTGRTSAHEGMKADEYLASQRSGKLVIVESPAKARTVGRFLGKGYTVRASVGHVRDLLRSSLSVDVENNFTPKYRVPNEKKEVVKELKELARQHSEIYLATDPDREGEAIAWHLMEAAQIEPRLAKRVVFHEITQTAIEDAFSHPREINMDLVNAQQARRVLDRLVGYSISPILWEKVRNRLSAGRVQSVALRLIVEREREIDAFIPVEYWTIAAEFKPQGIRSTYIAKLAKIDAVDPELPDEATVLPIVTDMEAATYSIARIKRGERRRKPLAPFITSTMQQEASRKLGYTARRTMSIAQQLYEGLDVGEGGSTGLITYMRTDSTNIAEVAQKEAREYIQQIYGQSFLPETPPQYKTRAVSAQEAHEAIRPTSVFRSPDKIKQYLTNDQFKLYQLVWQRFLASQMEAAVFDTLSIEIEAKTQIHEYLLRVSGSTVKFPGYLVVYEEAVDEDQKTEEENARIPSGLEEGQRQNLVRVIPEQHFTQPPPRYSEATLVQVLEEYGIGRPSTYAPILSTIQERGYVIREAKRLFPTETGILVNDIMVQHFPSIVDLHFTAHMEADLDQVAAGQEGWTDVVAEFYREFEPVLRRAQEAIPVTKAELEKIGRICPDCGGDLVIRWGRYGKFISCNNFPNCRHTEALLEKIGVKCPNDGGEIVIRKTRKGRIFYGCANYPNCEFTSWKQPIPVPCPKCGGLLVIANKREMQCTKCEETFLVEHVTEKSSETA